MYSMYATAPIFFSDAIHLNIPVLNCYDRRRSIRRISNVTLQFHGLTSFQAKPTNILLQML